MLASIFGMGPFGGPPMQAPAHDAAEQQQAKASLGSLATAPQRTVPPGDIHLGVAKGIYAVLNELGADPDEVIAESGVDPRIFGDPDNQIAVSALGRLVLHCVARTNCPHFGLLVGARATLESVRLVGSLMRCAAPLGQALR